MKLLHYVASSYEFGSFGGVARFDNELKKAIGIKTFLPRQRSELLDELSPDSIVITDNGKCMDIPDCYKCIVVHHGIARIHKRREPAWNGSQYLTGQEKMSNRKNTYFISPSSFVQRHVKIEHGIDSELILHSVDLEKQIKPRRTSLKPVVIGDWRGYNKGEMVARKLMASDKYEFKFLKCGNDKESKQAAYAEADIYLALSLCEGNSYSALDALACGIPVLSTDVGLFGGDCPTGVCGEIIDWKERNNTVLIEEKLDYMMNNIEKYTPSAWVSSTNSFEKWCKRWREYVMKINFI